MFALRSANDCFGGHRLANAIALSESAACDSPCSGNAGETCGGSGVMSLYTTQGGRHLGCAGRLPFTSLRPAGCHLGVCVCGGTCGIQVASSWQAKGPAGCHPDAT